MKQLINGLLLVAALNSGVSMADNATLIVPQALEVLYVNGEEYEGRMFSLGSKTLELLPGEQQIVLQYDTIWEVDADNHERVTSKPMMLTLHTLEDKTYQVKLPVMLELAEANAFIDAPSLTVIDKKSGAEIAVQLAFKKDEVAELKNYTTDFDNIGDLDHDEVLEQLRHWWSQASQSQRERFMAEIISGK